MVIQKDNSSSVDSGGKKVAADKSSSGVASSGASGCKVVSLKDFGLSTKQGRASVSNLSFSSSVRSLVQGWRQGTASCKARAEVAFSNKKPWKQKGTGRSRAGDKKSPLWRKGGVTFGPCFRSRSLKVNKKVRRGVLAALFYDRLDSGGIVSMDWVPEPGKLRTSVVSKLLADSLDSKLLFGRLVVFSTFEDYPLFIAFANLPNVRVMLLDEMNVYSLGEADFWVFLKKDFDIFKRTVLSWI